MSAPTKSRNGALEAVGAAVVALAAFATIPLGMFVHAWALRALWAWFVVPALHVSSLTYGSAMGLSLIPGLFRRLTPDDPKDAERSTTAKVSRAIGASLLAPASIWCVGWIVQRVIA